MTITGFIVRNTFRNKRRSLLTVLSIGFSLLLLTLMMTIWRTFYIDQGAPDSAKRLMTRHKVSLTFFLPGFYREKIRSLPGVVYVAPMTWFGGRYKDNKPENFFAQFATDPEEYLKVAADKNVPADEAQAWIHDRAGAMVDAELAKRYGWKVGDRITLQGTIFPVNPELTIRAIFTMTPSNKTLYCNSKYREAAVSWYKGETGFSFTRVASPEDIAPASRAIDDMFRNSPQPTKTESEKAFQLSFIAMLGNVKAFILSICAAVVFGILLVAANTMAMSIRERTREVAMLKTLGFTRQTVLGLFIGEAMALALAGGLIGTGFGYLLVYALTHSPQFFSCFNMKVTRGMWLSALLAAVFVGFLSAFIPSYHAS